MKIWAAILWMLILFNLIAGIGEMSQGKHIEAMLSSIIVMLLFIYAKLHRVPSFT